MKITVSAIKADVGGIGGHTRPSDGLLNAVKSTVKGAGDMLLDHYIGYCGDDIHIVMSHTLGTDSDKVHGLACFTISPVLLRLSTNNLYNGY